MCFGKTKTVKSLKALKATTEYVKLGYNTTDSCDYIDYESIEDLKAAHKDLRIIQFNVRGLKSKLDEIDTLITDLKLPDIIIISETWLKEGEEKFVNISGYTFEGMPRPRKKGGG